MMMIHRYNRNQHEMLGVKNVRHGHIGCERYFTELTAMVQLQVGNDHAFAAYFPAESSASSLQDVTKLEFTQIHWTDDRLQRMSNLPDRVSKQQVNPIVSGDFFA